MKQKRVLLIVIPVVLVVAVAALATWLYVRARGDAVRAAQKATQRATGVILIPVEYKEERWVAGEEGVQILPCEPPTYYLSGGATEPLVQLLDARERVVYERNLEMDPRILVQEGPSDQPNVLDEVSFVLRLPFLGDAQSLEFFVEPADPSVAAEDAPQTPDLRVEFGAVAAAYEAMGAMEQRAPCQEPEYKPDALKP